MEHTSADAKHKKTGGEKTPDTEFGSLLRGALRGIAGYRNEDIGLVHEEIALEIGIDAKTVPNYYKGKGYIDERFIKRLLIYCNGKAYLSREWAEAFVGTAERTIQRHFKPEVRELLDQLWPPKPDAPVSSEPAAPARPTHNLPAPTYPQFVMRSIPYQTALDGLNWRTALVVIIGMGGAGKSSLAREIAECCLRTAGPAGDKAEATPSFEAAVWVSDKAAPGTTTLNVVLDEIAFTLDRADLTRFDLELKRRSVERLLRNQPVLLIVDNFETVADAALPNWLCSVPPPSKALVTSREYPAAFPENVCRIDLEQLSEEEGRAFVDMHAAAIRLSPVLYADAYRDVLTATGGNPIAIEILLGLAKTKKRAAADLTALFSAPIQTRGDVAVQGRVVRLLDALFATSYAGLSQAEQAVLLAMTLLPDSVPDTVLALVTGVDAAAFVAATQQLSDLALLATEQPGAPVTAPYELRRALHPLVRQFVTAKQQDEAAWVMAAGERWLAWADDYATRYGGHRPNEPVALRHLDREERLLRAALEWAAQHEYHAQVVLLADKLEYFYYARARWGDKRALHERYLAAAQQAGDVTAQVRALTLDIIQLSRQGRVAEIQDKLQALQLLEAQQTLTGGAFFNLRHAQALAAMAAGELEMAAQRWQDILSRRDERAVAAQLITGTLHWLGLCRLRQGELSAARQLLETSLAAALEQGNARRAARNQIALASFALDQGQLDEAGRWLEAAQPNAQPDPEQRAHALLALGRLHAARELHDDARLALNEALTLFERMGLEPEVREVRARMEGLDT